jgi:2-oxo-4-hydroxy-4-carboxy-5-ureidoimidazoline decarboxylase
VSARIADYLNALSAEDVREMARSRPFASDAAVLEAAERTWWGLQPAAWLQAFASHPRIGETSGGERGPPKTSATAWSREEQSGVAKAAAGVRAALALGNREYEQRFGHVFLICATGRSAEDMLAELRRRLDHDPARELEVAAGEQAKITRLRLEKLAVS